jgi:hypothetical protein
MHGEFNFDMMVYSSNSWKMYMIRTIRLGAIVNLAHRSARRIQHQKQPQRRVLDRLLMDSLFVLFGEKKTRHRIAGTIGW